MKTNTRATGVVTLLCGLGACQGATLNLGNNDAGVGPTPSSDSGITSTATATADATANAMCPSPALDADGGASGAAPTDAGLGDAASGLSGTYTGYIQDYTFPDKSDSLRMTLQFGEDGTVTGTVHFGDAPDFAPPTDPDVGYPPGWTGAVAQFDPVFEGFAFSVIKGTYAPPRLQIWLDLNEVWKQWCELQTVIYPSYASGSDGTCGECRGYGCLPTGAGGGNIPGGDQCQWVSCDHPQPTPVDCGKFGLCTLLGHSVCTCNATNCTVLLTASGAASFDMTLSGSALDGSTNLLSQSGSLYNVHLTGQ